MFTGVRIKMSNVGTWSACVSRFMVIGSAYPDLGLAATMCEVSE